MATMTTENIEDIRENAGKFALIDIETALAIRAMSDALGLSRSKLKGHFRCEKCGQPLSPHRHGQPHQGPHFEHYRGNKRNCKQAQKLA